MHRFLLFAIICAGVLCAGCGKSAEQKAREQAELDAKVAEKLRTEKIAETRERAAEAIASKERAKVRDEDIRREADATFAQFDRERPAGMQDIQDAATIDAAAGRVRSLMSDPLSMEVRNSSVNAQKTAVCLLIDYKESGTSVGARQALVTADAVLVEPDKNNVAHRVFEISAKNLGCDVALDTKRK